MSQLISILFTILVFTLSVTLTVQQKQCKKVDPNEKMGALPVQPPESCKKLGEKGKEFGMGQVYPWYEHYFDGCVANKVSN